MPHYSLLAMVIPPYQLHSPVATTGDFLLQGNPTVQCTHCALSQWHVSPKKVPFPYFQFRSKKWYLRNHRQAAPNSLSNVQMVAHCSGQMIEDMRRRRKGPLPTWEAASSWMMWWGGWSRGRWREGGRRRRRQTWQGWWPQTEESGAAS